jgi:hypothetical protein
MLTANEYLIYYNKENIQTRQTTHNQDFISFEPKPSVFVRLRAMFPQFALLRFWQIKMS